jgi:transposase
LHAREANQIRQWCDQRLEGATGVFGAAPKSEAEPVIDMKTLHAKIGELAPETDFLSGALGKAGLLCRCALAYAWIRESGAQKMNDRTSKLSVSRLAGVLGISGGGVIASLARSRTPI